MKNVKFKITHFEVKEHSFVSDTGNLRTYSTLKLRRLFNSCFLSIYPLLPLVKTVSVFSCSSNPRQHHLLKSQRISYSKNEERQHLKLLIRNANHIFPYQNDSMFWVCVLEKDFIFQRKDLCLLTIIILICIWTCQLHSFLYTSSISHIRMHIQHFRIEVKCSEIWKNFAEKSLLQ